MQVQSEDAIAGVTCHSGNIASLREILSGKMALVSERREISDMCFH